MNDTDLIKNLSTAEVKKIIKALNVKIKEAAKGSEEHLRLVAQRDAAKVVLADRQLEESKLDAIRNQIAEKLKSMKP